MGRTSGLKSEISSRKTPGSAKAIILLQAVVIGFLSFWAFEEYQNNLYFQAYVNSTVQTNVLALGMVLIGIPVFTIAIYGMVRISRRSGQSVPLESVASEDNKRQTISRPDLRIAETPSESHGPPTGFEEMAMKFLKQAGAVTSPSNGRSSSERMPFLERVEPVAAARPKTPEKPFPVLERLEPRQEQSSRSVFQAPQRVPERTPLGRNIDYRPPQQVPRASGPVPGPVQARPMTGAPMVRPSTVVTGIMGQGPRPSQQRSQTGLGAVGPGQGMEQRPLSQKWSPGGRPENPGMSQRDRPSTVGPSIPPGSRALGPSTADPILPVSPPPLGRVGPVQAAGEKLSGEKPSLSLGRVQPAQAAANKLPWLKVVAPDQNSLFGSSSQQLGVDSTKPPPKSSPSPELETGEKKQPGQSSPPAEVVAKEKPGDSDTTVAASSRKSSSDQKRDERKGSSAGP